MWRVDEAESLVSLSLNPCPLYPCKYPKIFHSNQLKGILSCVESYSQAKHKVVRVLEFIKLIAGVDEYILGYIGFQHKNLIERICVSSFAQEVFANTNINGENRHYYFRSERKAGRELFPEWWAIELQIL